MKKLTLKSNLESECLVSAPGAPHFSVTIKPGGDRTVYITNARYDALIDGLQAHALAGNIEYGVEDATDEEIDEMSGGNGNKNRGIIGNVL